MKKVYTDILVIVCGFVVVALITRVQAFYYVSALAAVLSLFPPLARFIVFLWRTFSKALGWLNSRILLTLFFIFIVSPMAFLYRLFKPHRTFLKGGWRDAEPVGDFKDPW